MINPHAVIKVDSVASAPVAKLGKTVSEDKHFPQGVNVGFMQVIDSQHIALRVYERGVGETLACGSGACAAVVAGRRQFALAETVNVDLAGGRLIITWRGDNHTVLMQGPAEIVFEAQLEL